MRVLVATDLSDAGMLAIETLIGCNPTLFEQVTLVHVIGPEHYVTDRSGPDAIGWPETALAAEARALSQAGFKADYRIEQGPEAEIIQSMATDIGAELIVATDRGKSGAPGRLLGSTAEKIALAGEAPVLVERVEEREATWCRLTHGSPFARPYMAADLDQTVRRVALAVGRLPGVEAVRIAHVATPGDDHAKPIEFISAEIAPTPLENAEVVVLESRDIAATLIEDAETFGASLIALAPRRHGVIGRLVFGSVALALLRQSRMPLLFA